MARGCISKRGRNYYIYWRDPEGRQRSKVIGPSKKQAEALAEIHTDMAKGVYHELKETDFSDFATRWLEDYATPNVKSSTLRSYKSAIEKDFIPFFGKRKLNTITAETIQRYVAQKMREGRSAKTAANHLTLLKTIFKHAVLWEYLGRNPAEFVKAPRSEPNEMDFLSPDEIQVFLAHIDDFYRPLFATAILTGMRLGELLALQWDDIDWNSGSIRVRRSLYQREFVSPKSKRSVRTIGMSPGLKDILLDHKLEAPAHEHDLVFTTEEGAMIDQSNLRRRVFHPALRRAGLRQIRIHDLGHTFASLLIHQGENLKCIQAQLGHASIQTTVDRYGHLMPDVHTHAGERLDEQVFKDYSEQLTKA